MLNDNTKLLEVQKKSYAFGSIWDLITDEEKNDIKNFYNLLVKFIDNKDLVTYLYSTSFKDYPKITDSGYYNKETSDEIEEFIKSLNDLSKLPHQKNKMVHSGMKDLLRRLNLDENLYDNVYEKTLNNVALKIIKKHYDLDYKIEQLPQAQITWYTEGDYITSHNDGPTGNRLCALLIYLTPEKYYKPGNGGELVLQDERNFVDLVYPMLGNYAVIDFTKNNPYHGVHKVLGDFNRFAYLNFITVQND